MRACFHPDATVRVLWYTGPVGEFLERTIKSHEERAPGEGSKHWFGNARAWVKGGRALLESDAQVQGRNRISPASCSISRSISGSMTGWSGVRASGASCAWMRFTISDRLDPVLAGTDSRRAFSRASI